MRVAAIDIGTNSIRMRIVEVLEGAERRTLADEKDYTRIGRGMGTTGRLSNKAMIDAVAVLGRMTDIAAKHDVSHMRAVATAAVRQAANAGEFLERVRTETGLDVEVISAEEEGRLAFLSATESIGVDGRCVVIDLGGGSMEVVRATDGQVDSIASVPLGAVAMSERYHSVDPMPKNERRKLKKYVRRTLATALPDDFGPVSLMIGSGGTVSAVARLIAAGQKQDLTSVHGFELRRVELMELLDSLVRTSAAERAVMKGLPESRVDIIVAGAVVLDETMRFLGVKKLVVNSRGMREGLLIDIIARERGC